MTNWFNTSLAKSCLRGFVGLSKGSSNPIACSLSCLFLSFSSVFYTLCFRCIRVNHVSNLIKERIAQIYGFTLHMLCFYSLNNNCHLKAVEGCLLFTWRQQYNKKCRLKNGKVK